MCWVRKSSYTAGGNDYNLAYNRVYNNDTYLYFSTKEKAEEYIIMNKPLLSIEDVKDHYCLGYIKDLKKLVKNKMS